MRLLVDTHVFLWAITDDPRLPERAREMWRDPQNELLLSVASLWEILIKSGLGKLPIPKPASSYLLRQMELNQVQPLAVRVLHMTELENLEPLHRDPFDRMLVAQARSEKLAILTGDELIRGYGVQTVY